MKWAKKFFLPLFCPTIRCKNIVADYRLEWVYESDQQKSIG
ncbi:serine kinase, partial [Enterococcus faecalis]|nr:serine kinase [Enterococcus faecalis]